jgi:predicted Holliday junction resolvase-like endonuclease
MNLREHAIAERYKKQGFAVLHDGAPDFLLVKNADGKIIDVEFVEVKARGARLTYSQKVWRDAIKFLGAKWKLEEIA